MILWHLILWLIAFVYFVLIWWVIYRVGWLMAKRDIQQARQSKNANRKRRNRWNSGDEFWW